MPLPLRGGHPVLVVPAEVYDRMIINKVPGSNRINRSRIHSIRSQR